MKLRFLSVAAALFVSVLALRPAAETAIAKPEDVGLSSERLARITEMMKRHVAAGEISGGDTIIIAKDGKPMAKLGPVGGAQARPRELGQLSEHAKGIDWVQWWREWKSADKQIQAEFERAMGKPLWWLVNDRRGSADIDANSSRFDAHVINASDNIAQRNLGFELQQVRGARRSGKTEKGFG